MKKIIAFIVLTLSFCITTQAQDAAIKEALKSYNKENDSLLLKYFRSRAEKQQLKELKMDSIPESCRYNKGTVHYSPDNAFKIFVFSAMHNYLFSIVSFHYSVTQFASGHIEENSGFSAIYSITPADDGSYIIVDYDTVVGSMVHHHILKLQHYKLKKDKLIQQPIAAGSRNLPIALRNYISRDNTSFLLSLDVDTPFKDNFITYDAKEKTVSYDYTHYLAVPIYPEHIPAEMIPSGKERLNVKGSFKLDNGTISCFKEEYQKTL